MKFLNQYIKSIFRKAGLELAKYRPQSSYSAQIIAGLKKFDIDLVFDVGANQGQFASDLRYGGYLGRIISFEPLSLAHEKLLQQSSRDENWNVYPRCAVGDQCGDVEINIAGNSASSSLLPMLESCVDAAPAAAYIGKESAPLFSLNFIAPKLMEGHKNIFLKIDAQGFEWQVLDGASNILPFIRGILVELSLVELYQGQRLWLEIVERLVCAGFNVWAIHPVFIDPSSGRTLQVDALFYK
jgi:FkbM family methyltransferase